MSLTKNCVLKSRKRCEAKPLVVMTGKNILLKHTSLGMGMIIQKLTDTDPVFDAANTINLQLATISMENLGIVFVNSFHIRP